MKQHHYLILFLLLAANAMMGTQCNKEFILIPPTYSFVEKLSLTPYKKIYAVNDTIWVQFKTTDKSLYDKISNSRIETDTTFLQAGFYYNKRFSIDTSSQLFCDAEVTNGLNIQFTKLYPWNNLLSFTTDCNSSEYFFKVGFIPKTTGIYSIDPYITAVNCANKITWNYTETKFIFDLADCNKDVWLSIPAAARGGESGFTDVSIDNKEIFVFKVE